MFWVILGFDLAATECNIRIIEEKGKREFSKNNEQE